MSKIVATFLLSATVACAQWMGVLSGGTAAPAPTLSSATIASDGNSITLAFSGNVTHGAGGEPTLAATAGASGTSPSNPTLTYSSGSGTSSLVYATSRSINKTAVETVALSYTTGGALSGVGTISSAATTNNSTAQTYTLQQTLSGTGNNDNVGDSSSNRWHTMQFSASSAYVLTKVGPWLSKTGSPTFNISAGIYTDSGSNAPTTTQVGSTSTSTVAASGLSGTWTETAITGLSVSLTNATKYWLALYSDAQGTGSNYVQWERQNTGTPHGFSSANTLSWTDDGQPRLQHTRFYSSP